MPRRQTPAGGYAELGWALHEADLVSSQAAVAAGHIQIAQIGEDWSDIDRSSACWMVET